MLEHCRCIATGNSVPHQILRPAKVRVGFGTERDAQEIAIARQRCDRRSRTEPGCRRRSRCLRGRWNTCRGGSRLSCGQHHRLVLGQQRVHGWLPVGDASDQRLRVWLWRQGRDLVLDLAFALVPSGRKQLSVILRREMRLQQRDSCQRESAVSDQGQDRWKTPRGSRHFDAVIGGVLGQVQHLRAVCKQRRAALTEIELSHVEFTQEREEFSGGKPFIARGAHGQSTRGWTSRPDSSSSFPLIPRQISGAHDSTTSPIAGAIDVQMIGATIAMR